MHVSLVILLYTANLVSWVESSCIDFHLGTAADYPSLCQNWWDDTYVNYGTYSNHHITSCMKLIQKKCPDMIATSVASKYRSHSDKKTYETWTTAIEAYLKSNPSATIVYKDDEEKPICHDNGIEYCKYWWTVVKKNNVKDEIKEVCINNMLKHCGTEIHKKGEGESTEVQRCFKSYDVKTVTYEYNGGLATVQQCAPQKKT